MSYVKSKRNSFNFLIFTFLLTFFFPLICLPVVKNERHLLALLTEGPQDGQLPLFDSQRSTREQV